MIKTKIGLAVFISCWIGAHSLAATVEFAAQGEMTPNEAAAVDKAAAIANAVVGSDCFRDFIALRNLIDANGKTPGEVARHLQGLSGRIPVAFYFHCMVASPACSQPTQAVAYRQPPEPTIYLNRAYYSVDDARFDIYEMAGSLAHEALGHALGGYDHSFDWTAQRDFSVPYSIAGASKANGDAFQACAMKVRPGR